MAEKKIMNRWSAVIGAVIIQLCLGAIYAWSVFTKPLVDAGWSRTQTQAVFAAGLALFAIVMVIAGRLMPKYGPRKLAIAGGVVLGLGYFLAGLFGELTSGLYSFLSASSAVQVLVSRMWFLSQLE